jgi:hypothetical protein
MQLTVKEVAALLGCTVNKLSNWRRPIVMKDGKDNPHYLPGTVDEERRVTYQITSPWC